MAKSNLSLNTQIAIREYTVGPSYIKIMYDLWSKTEGSEKKVNSEPIEMVVDNNEIVELRRSEASKHFRSRKSGAEETFDDIEHYIISRDPFFVSKREFIKEFDGIIKEHLDKTS